MATYNISHRRGDTLKFSFTQNDDTGAPINLNGYTIWAEVALLDGATQTINMVDDLQYSTSNIVVQDAGSGNILLHIAASDTAQLAPLCTYVIKGDKQGFISSFLHGYISLKG